MKARALPIGGLFLPVLSHPGFPTLASGGVAAGEDKRGDFGVSDFLAAAAVLEQNSNERGFECGTRDAIEEVAFESRTVLLGKCDVTAIVEGFFESLAEVFFVGYGGNPTFQFFVFYARGDFERVRILDVWRMLILVACFFSRHMF